MDEQRAVQIIAVEPGDLEAFVGGWLHENSASAKTLAAYTDTITRFQAELAVHGLRLGSMPGLVAAVAQAWVRRRGDGRPSEASAATQNLRLAILSSFYRYANRMTDEREVPNPIAKVKRQPVQAYAGAHALEEGEVRTRLRAIDRTTLVGKRDYALLTLALQTGRRATELRLLSVEHLRVEGGRLHITWPRNKGKQMRDTLPEGVAAALLAWLCAFYGVEQLAALAPSAPIAVALARDPKRRGQRMTRQALADVWQRRLGTSKVHSSRHTFAHLMEQAGARVSEIQARLGHSNIATTGRYLAALTSGENPYATILERKLGIGA